MSAPASFEIAPSVVEVLAKRRGLEPPDAYGDLKESSGDTSESLVVEFCRFAWTHKRLWLGALGLIVATTGVLLGLSSSWSVDASLGF
jgi:hypothetical protein